MKVKSDQILIDTATNNPDGSPREPEEAPAARVILTDAEVSNGASAETPSGSIPASIVLESTAGEMATGFRYTCMNCKHFNAHAWSRLHQAWRMAPNDSIDAQQLNAIRAGLLTTQNADLASLHNDGQNYLDVEGAVQALGVCEPLSEIDGDIIIVHPLGGCPEMVRSPMKPQGLFDARDLDAEKRGSAVFDGLMRKAQGNV